MSSEKLDRIIERQSEHGMILAKIETDLRHHIKRSDQHEVHLKEQDKRVQKIWYVLIAGAAAGISEYGAIILKYLGNVL